VTLFGAWLVQRGRVTAAHILSALEQQERQRPAFHEVAMSMRRLSAAVVLDVLDAQRTTGKTFEMQAVSLGLLTRADVETIHTEQMRHGPKLGQVLVQLGHLNGLQLERELADFLQANERPSPATWTTAAVQRAAPPRSRW